MKIIIEKVVNLSEDELNQLEILFQVTRKQTFKNRPETDFQIGDFQKSTAEDGMWIAKTCQPSRSEQMGNKRMIAREIIVGFVSTYPKDNFIHNLFVLPGHQGRGIGAKLLFVAESSLQKPMTLKIAMDNAKVCSFYEKYGWCKLSEHVDEMEPYWLYEK